MKEAGDNKNENPFRYLTLYSELEEKKGNEIDFFIYIKDKKERQDIEEYILKNNLWNYFKKIRYDYKDEYKKIYNENKKEIGYVVRCTDIERIENYILKIHPPISPIINNNFKNNMNNFNNMNYINNMSGNNNMNMLNNNIINNNLLNNFNLNINNRFQPNDENFIFVTFTFKKNRRQIYIDVDENDTFGNMLKRLESKYDYLKTIRNKSYLYKDKIISDFSKTLKQLNIDEASDIYIF